LPIALTFQSEDCIRSRFDTAGNPPREVHPQKRKTWVSDRVDQIAHQLTACRHDLVIFAAERNNAKAIILPGQPHNPIAVQAGTVDNAVRLDGAPSCFQHSLGRVLFYTLDPALREDLAT